MRCDNCKRFTQRDVAQPGLARLLGVQEVAGSNPVVPTRKTGLFFQKPLKLQAIEYAAQFQGFLHNFGKLRGNWCTLVYR
jgi:hypothetical protein